MPRHARKTALEIPLGYQKVFFRDWRLVLKETETGHAEALCNLLRAVFDGAPAPSVKRVPAGRGMVHFARLQEDGEIVIRPYRHGGQAEKIFGGYFASPRRFLRELVLTERARAAGVTALEPIGIAYRKRGWGFEGAWISFRLTEAESLLMYLCKNPPDFHLIKEVARTVARMHRAGIDHPDLTVQNILIVSHRGEGHTVSIIDFDKASWRSSPDLRNQMRQLRRLDRSLLKWAPPESPWRAPAARLRFAAAYVKENPDIRPLIREYLRRFEKYEKGYRLGWALQRGLGRVRMKWR